MQLIYPFLKLVRYPNLLFIFVTQYLIQYCVIRPVFQKLGISLTLSNGWFFLLALSLVLIAAAGYIINDCFDIKIDRVNKPDRVIIDRIISRRWAILLYMAFNLTGVILGFLIGWKEGYLFLGLTQLLCAGSLWFYSRAYKRQLLIGNIVVSVLTALPVLIAGFFEIKLYGGMHVINVLGIYHLSYIILIYASFAFIISMIREIVKDIEDIKGDAQSGCRTLPVVYGVNAGKDLSCLLSWILITLIIFVQILIFSYHWYFIILYLLLLVQLPLITVIKKLSRAATPEDFHYISSFVKLIMLTGIISMIFFNFY